MNFLIASAVAGFIAGALIAGFAANYYYDDEIEDLKKEARTQIEQQRARADAANLAASNAAASFEAWKKAQKPKIVTVTEEVERVIQVNPEWASMPIPDSVRNTLATIPSNLNTTESVDGMRSVQQPYTGQ